MNKNNLIKLGSVTQPHGIKGEADLRLLNPEDSILDENMKVWLYPTSPKSALKEIGEQWTIDKIRFGNKVICLFRGIQDRTHLEKLLPFEVYIEREAFPEADEGEVYLVDLVDMPVFDTDGNEIGRLESFSDNGMQYLFNLRLSTGELITLPYVEAFFPEIDVENKRIVAVLPDYTE